MTFGLTQQELRTDRLVLRPLRPSDAGPMTLYCGDERLARMTASIPHPYPPGAASAYIDAVTHGRNGHTCWAMDASASIDEELIGVVMLKSPDELGYWVGEPFWNTGFATEAVQGVVAHLTQSGLTGLRACVFKDNPASRSVLEKAGFQAAGEGWAYSVARGEAVGEWRLRHGGAIRPGEKVR
ncbi:MAG: GNAT family N-acetyltransferase [Pseudomonadota bacterium]